MICGVFGLPGAGKSTFLTCLALRALQGKPLSVGHFRYKKMIGEPILYQRVFSNVPIEGTYKLDFDSLGVYDFSYSLILIDEISLFCDSRNWKEFRSDLRDFMALHRHYHCTIVYFSQNYKDTDIKIRNLTERLFCLDRCGEFSRVRPIDQGFKIDEQITTGYYLSPPLSGTYIYRRKYYRYFDSFAAPLLPANPAQIWDTKAKPKPEKFAKVKRYATDFLSKAKKYFSPDDSGRKKAIEIAKKINSEFSETNENT